MTLFVDDALIAASVPSGSRVHSSRWSHLTSDLPGEEGTSELIEFAKSLGLRPSWIQYRGTWKEHFDLTEPKRFQAMRRGAVPLSGIHERVALSEARRERHTFDLVAWREKNNETAGSVDGPMGGA